MPTGNTSVSKEYQDRMVQQGLAAAGFSSLPLAAAGFLDLNENNSFVRKRIELKEAQRMFPQANPDIFKPVFFGDPTIPGSQSTANYRLFKDALSGWDTPETAFNPTRFLKPINVVQNPVGIPSPELGTFQQYLQSQPTSTTPVIQALTVTPSPSPSRFSDASLEKADAFANLLNKNPEDIIDEHKQISSLKTLIKEYPPQGGYVWGNIRKPQYSYAERTDPKTGAFMESENPSVYVSRINANPDFKQEYLFTDDVANQPPLISKGGTSKRLEGPSWGIRGDSSSAGLADNDISFRKDLIESRGELTTGDLQALLKAKNLPYEMRAISATGEIRGETPSEILRKNLTTLANAENITPFEAVQRYARMVPRVGESSTPPTQAATSRRYNTFLEGPAINPDSKYIKEIDLRKIGILPPTNPNNYDPGLELRPKAAQRLLDRTVGNLLKQAEPTKGLGLGGIGAGALATAMDPGVIDALSRGDYGKAGQTAAVNTGIGAIAGTGINAGLRSLQAAGYARPAAIVGGALPAVGGVLTGLGAAETVKALDRAYQGATGRGWTTRGQVRDAYPTYAGPTPQVKPRMATAILGGKEIQVPYGSVAGMRKVGRPWWDTLGSKAQGFVDALNRGSIIGR